MFRGAVVGRCDGILDSPVYFEFSTNDGRWLIGHTPVADLQDQDTALSYADERYF